jgi:aryl-alcohol dehydrogenase-like predicted oxidoreductase
MIAKRLFGNTGLQVSVLGLGTAEIGFSGTDASTVRSILKAAADVGINVLDSAAMYGDAEEILGQLLVGQRKNFLIVTKCGASLPRLPLPLRVLRRVSRRVEVALGKTPLEWQAKTFRRNIDESLRRLRTERIDLMLLHSCPEEILKRGDAIQVLQRAQAAGKVQYIGYSGDGAAALWAVRSGLFQAIEISVSIADQQSIDEVIPKALAGGLGIIAKRPIANVIWRRSVPPQEPYLRVYYDRMRALDYRFTTEPDAIATALRFTLSTGAHTAIVGTTSLDHMRSNIEAALAFGGVDARYEEIRDRWREIASPDWVGET